MSDGFEDYRDRYGNIRMEREEGVLLVALHTNGGPFVNSGPARQDLAYALTDIARDPENRVMIFTGTGREFCTRSDSSSMPDPDSPEGWYQITVEGKWIIQGMLDIEIPVISVVNGPVTRHSELLLLADMVLAAESATFQEGTHLPRMVPGDGMHILWPHLIGDIRARYFLLTGQVIDAQEGKRLGIVNEVLPDDEVLDRARVLARGLAEVPDITLRYTRALFTQRIRRLVNEQLPYGLAVEGLSRLAAPNVKYGTDRPTL
jgi:enoyl-CoA hydratase/carnithine racemase